MTPLETFVEIRRKLTPKIYCRYNLMWDDLLDKI